MAEYIEDSGAFNKDALFSGVKGVDYDYDAAQKIVWFSATGEADSGYVLPEAPFIIYEVYDPDSFTNGLGGNNVHSKTEFEGDVGTIGTTIAAWLTAYKAATAYTTFKVKATYYKGNGVADVYSADESTDFSLTISGGGYTGISNNLIINDDLFSDDVTEDLTPPIYLLTEPIIGDQPWYVFNSADSGEKFNGETLSSGFPWNPVGTVPVAYPQDGTIDLSPNKSIDTQWIMPANELLTFTFIDSVVMDSSYRMISLVPQGDGATANVLYDGVLDPVDTGLNYTPPLTPFELNSDTAFISIPRIPTCVITMDKYAFGVGDTAVVTFTFNVEINHVGASSLISAENGTLTDFLETPDKPWEYTATFTPDADVSDDTNVIGFFGQNGGVWDNWDNPSNANFESANYTVNTGASFVPVYIAFGSTGNNQTPMPDGVTINQSSWRDDTTTILNCVDIDNNPTDVTMQSLTAWTHDDLGNISGDNSLCVSDYEAKECWREFTANTKEIQLYIPAGTFTVSVSAFSDAVDGASDNWETEYILDGQSVFTDGKDDWQTTYTHCASFAPITSTGTGEYFTMQVKRVVTSYYLLLSSIRIEGA